jgi:pilus assembly protein Flp/PilA
MWNGGSVEMWISKRLEPRRPEMQFIRKMIKDTKGATAIEYGLIAALIAVAAITAMSQLGTQLGTTFNDVKDCMKTSSTC